MHLAGTEPPISGILWTDLFAVLKNITEIPGALDLNATFEIDRLARLDVIAYER